MTGFEPASRIWQETHVAIYTTLTKLANNAAGFGCDFSIVAELLKIQIVKVIRKVATTFIK
ncbi:MAG: hypothetical protein EBW21_04190 [Actinobacteria bacterium]|nr:hypothetical protein [Actinomycetota bacterium]